jgi:hypothetical protein
LGGAEKIKGIMNWLMGRVFGKEEEENEESLPKEESSRSTIAPLKKRNRTTEDTPLISLHGRDTPIDLLEKASFRISHAKDAVFGVNPSSKSLTVNLPKRGSRTKRKDYVMPMAADLDALMADVKEQMELDEFTTMDSVRLAAEYPYFFWNGMFHCLGNMSVLDAKMHAAGIDNGKRRRRGGR